LAAFVRAFESGGSTLCAHHVAQVGGQAVAGGSWIDYDSEESDAE
jgi:hypothetical protein